MHEDLTLGEKCLKTEEIQWNNLALSWKSEEKEMMETEYFRRIIMLFRAL